MTFLFKIQHKYVIFNAITSFIVLVKNITSWLSTEQTNYAYNNTKSSETQIIWTLNLWKYEFCNPVFVATKKTVITYESISYVSFS